MTLAGSIERYRFHLTGLAILTASLYLGVLPDMARQWYSDGNYSHGFIVPLVSAYFLYERREMLKNAEVSPCGPGLVVVILGLLQLVAGFLASEYFTKRSSLILLLAGIILFLWGKKVFRLCLLPLGYLTFMVPLPYIVYDSLAFPLKMFVTRISVWFMNMIGIVVLREGNIIVFPALTLEVADACSGMRSLMALLALGVAYAFLLRTDSLTRWLIIGATVPIAIAANALRVIMTGILAQHWGERVARGFFHEFAGFLVFALALAMLIGLGVALGSRGHRPKPWEEE